MKKLKTVKALVSIIRELQRKGQKVVFTNGCFDLLHLGHIMYLKKAKKYGDVLVVGLNSDKSVRRLKGPMRPLFPLNERAEILASLECVDYVTVFKEDTPLKIIKELKPNILIKGGDYTLDKIVGRSFLNSIGGKTVTVPFIKNKSTSNIIEKIASCT